MVSDGTEDLTQSGITPVIKVDISHLGAEGFSHAALGHVNTAIGPVLVDALPCLHASALRIVAGDNLLAAAGTS